MYKNTAVYTYTLLCIYRVHGYRNNNNIYIYYSNYDILSGRRCNTNWLNEPQLVKTYKWNNSCTVDSSFSGMSR